MNLLDKLRAAAAQSRTPPKSSQETDYVGGPPITSSGMQPQKTGGCCGGNLFTKIMDFEATVADLGKFIADMALDKKASQGLVEQRKMACETCQEIDSKGARLYRPWKDIHTCGLIRLRKFLRDSRVDGCGCMLELKWHGVDQTCPKGRW